MSTKEIFLLKLKKNGYKWHRKPELTDDFSKILDELEPDRDNVFHAIYGDALIQNHGTKPIKEYIYRLMEAEKDLQMKYIKSTMHYLIMQIHTNALKL